MPILKYYKFTIRTLYKDIYSASRKRALEIRKCSGGDRRTWLIYLVEVDEHVHGIHLDQRWFLPQAWLFNWYILHSDYTKYASMTPSSRLKKIANTYFDMLPVAAEKQK